MPGPEGIFALATAVCVLEIFADSKMGGPLAQPLVVSLVGNDQFAYAEKLYERHGYFPAWHFFPHFSSRVHDHLLAHWLVRVLL
jgi:hypothetical protein